MCKALRQKAVQVALGEASGGVGASPMSASNRLLQTFDCAATCLHKQVCNTLCLEQPRNGAPSCAVVASSDACTMQVVANEMLLSHRQCLSLRCQLTGCEIQGWTECPNTLLSGLALHSLWGLSSVRLIAMWSCSFLALV